MGFFSWLTSDTQQSIANTRSGKKTIEVKIIDDKNNEFIESYYSGYGEFGGMDFFVLAALMNGAKYKKAPKNDIEVFEGYRLSIHNSLEIARLRDIGLDIVSAYEECKGNYKLPKLVTVECKTKYSDLPDSENCPFQGYFYN